MYCGSDLSPPDVAGDVLEITSGRRQPVGEYCLNLPLQSSLFVRRRIHKNPEQLQAFSAIRWQNPET